MDDEYKYIVKGKLGLLAWGAKFRGKTQADDYVDRMNEEASPHAIEWEVGSRRTERLRRIIR